MATDLYSLPHKALRAAMATAGAALGAQRSDAVDLAVQVIADLAAHGEHEDELIHPILHRHLPDVAVDLDRQHRDLEDLLAVTTRALLTDDAYRAFQRLVAWNLRHLDHEETVVLPALWRAVPEEELAGVLASFRAAHPDAGAIYARWPTHLSDAERSLVGLS
ncbi:MAG TPA: hemerythrin domain-containing protein [Acidimicrobiales bacterium]|nr:hemerythrin domain-containing protein [Acidimicrobiales bacterium]